MMPTFIQKSLSSSLELLQSTLAAGPGQFLDETGRMDEVLEPLLFLTSLHHPEGHTISPVAYLASLLLKGLPGYKSETAVP